MERGNETSSQQADIDPRLLRLARLGWLAKGVVYTVTGIIVVRVGLGSSTGGDDASASGALEGVASQPFGRVLLVVLAIGLFLHAAWRAVNVWVVDGDGLDDIGSRLGYAISAVTYAALGGLAVSMAWAGRESSGDSSSSLLRGIMDQAWGRLIVAIVGLAVIGVAVAFARRGLDSRFKEELDLSEMSAKERRAIEVTGTVGWIARAVVFALVGVFLVNAAVTYSPDDAKGIDGVLREVAETPWGAVLVSACGIGFALYGVFCLVSWRHRKLAT